MGRVHSNSDLGLAMINYTSKSYSSFWQIQQFFSLILVHSVVKPAEAKLSPEQRWKFLVRWTPWLLKILHTLRYQTLLNKATSLILATQLAHIPFWVPHSIWGYKAGFSLLQAYHVFPYFAYSPMNYYNCAARITDAGAEFRLAEHTYC